MTWIEQRRISVPLAAATLVPIAALGWLGVRILQQDRDIERQRQRERLEVAAGRLALDIERWLQQAEEQLTAGKGIAFDPTGLKAAKGLPLLYQPETPPGQTVSPADFADAEAAEFQRQDLAAAAEGYARLAASTQPDTRATALLGLGRVHRRRGDRAGALDAYARLEALGTTVVAGQPAGLVGLQGRAKVLEAAGDQVGLRATSATLAEALTTGRWAADRATFDLYREMTERWGAPGFSPDVVARTEAAVELWHTWRDGGLSSRGRRLVRAAGTTVLAVWAGGPERPVAWLATTAEIDASLHPLWNAQRLNVSLADTDGQVVIAGTTTGGLSLTPAETRLPFVLTVAPAEDPDVGPTGARGLTLISGLVATFLLMLAAAYFLYRATTREMMLARQQSDFVSAVSHEFRTPLTSLRHLTDLLVSRGVPSEERRTEYYGLLARETERLHRMVESLLSFGRIEVGSYAWRLEPADAGALVRASVTEFRGEPQAGGREIALDIQDPLPPIQADREAVSRAVWNLLENAAKYSRAPSPIRVSVRRDEDSVLISVCDDGPGIPKSEHERIFHKFVRGAGARRAGIGGVGIGLSLVQRIVTAHGGTVRLESAPGRGSTFTLVLPALDTSDTSNVRVVASL